MTPIERKVLVARYRAGYDEVVRALDAITPAELEFRPAPAEWSAREVVHHLADSEMIAGGWLRRVLAEPGALHVAYDPAGLARELRYQDLPHEPALACFRGVRATTGELLDRMTDADWTRVGQHSKRGAYPVELWLESYGGHAHEHADQIRANRAAFRARG